MGFLTDEENQSLRITKMILHVVGDQDFTPETARVVEHEQFFISRIRQADLDPVYSFTETSRTKQQLERIARAEDGFEAGAQELSHEFSRLHVRTSREGAFFIFEMETVAPNTKIYALVKYDYSEAIEQDDNDLLRRIVHAFIADKKAIQKSAIVRIVNGRAEAAIAAHDRVKQAPEIGDYFISFLEVERTRSDQELNRKVVEVLREALEPSKAVLPDQDVARAFRYAKNILRDRAEIDEDTIADAVIAAAGNPEDEGVRVLLIRRVQQKIKTAKLSGLRFRPDRQVLRKPATRRVKTTEGVTIIYPDDENGLVVRQVTANGGEIITIETEQVTEDKVVRDTAR